MFIQSNFNSTWWLKNRHLQTIWGTLFRQKIKLPAKKRLRMELNDGDFIDVDLFVDLKQRTKSFVLLLHGLEGDLDSHYIRGMVLKLLDMNKQVAVMHFRGCSGESNRKPYSYHSGVSDDLQLVIELLAEQKIEINYLVGFSLGGNVLLKWLGENRTQHSVKAAAAISVPMLLDECATSIDQGFSKVYSKRLLKTLKIKSLEKKQLFPSDVNLSKDEINQLKTFWEFDEKVTAPLHGFLNAKDYYQKVSSRQFIKLINIPTLIIHAKDDPFMSTKVIPEVQELSPSVCFELSDTGGHVGFIQGRWPWSAEYYLEQRVPEFLDKYV